MVARPVYQDTYAKTEATIAARSVEVFEQHRSWRFCHRKSDWHPFFMMDGSPVRQPDGTMAVPTYCVDLHDCTCPSHSSGRVACKHMRAVRLWFNAVKRGELQIPRRMTAGDRAILEAENVENEAMDTAESADALLDAYHQQQAQHRAQRYAEPEEAWWRTERGGIVWLQDGDRIGPDDGELPFQGGNVVSVADDVEVGVVPTPVPEPVADLSAIWPSCAVDGCTDDREPHEIYCRRHVIVDAF